jgi:hypothetical protein
MAACSECQPGGIGILVLARLFLFPFVYFFGKIMEKVLSAASLRKGGLPLNDEEKKSDALFGGRIRS